MTRTSLAAAQVARGLALVLFLAAAVVAGLGALDVPPDPSRDAVAAVVSPARV